MKKLFNLALFSAIALTGAVGFSSCSSSSDEVIDNPNYNPETNTVKAQFAISLPQEIKSQTRQTEVVVQESGFRGMDNIKLIPYSEAVTGTSTANSNLTDLTPITAFDHDESNSKVYTDVEFIPGTSNFLFYGKAVDNAAGTDITSAADKFKFGYLTPAGLTGKPNLLSVSFAPKVIYDDGDATEQTAITAGKAVGTALIAALNAVADAAPTTALSGGGTPKFKEVAATVNPTVNGLFNIYKSMTTASSHSVQTMFFKLYSSLDPLAAGSGDDKLLANAIRGAIETYCDVTKDATTQATTAVTFKSSANLTGYPASVNLPDGAVRVTYSSNTFVAATDMNYAGTMNVATLDKYVYPANLQYFVNSPIKVANSQKSPLYNTSTWETILSDLYKDGTSITANTRSVAITKPVQYGVGRLDASVSKLTGTYYDYNGAEVNVTSGYTLTGILIGDQKAVGWDFTTKTGSTAFTIYDKSLSTGNWTITASAASETNYTLVLETVGGDSPENVRVALEFLNNGNEFVGANGEIIPAGGRFYLVGELKPTAVATYDANTKGVDRVFTQDYKTIANFTINNGSSDSTNANYRKGLGSATNGLPDLRTSSMELGLSVDLTWKAGLTFDVNM